MELIAVRISIGAAMPTPAQDNPAAHHAAPAPTISGCGHVITGSGFLPNHGVAIHITRAGDDISDYLTYTTDPSGHLHADLPASAAVGSVRITATDHRPDPGGPCGRLWSNTCTLNAVDM
jgi:hypothetical protein